MDAFVSDAFQAARQAVLDTYDNSRERSLVLTKLEEAELWCGRAATAAPVGTSSVEAEEIAKKMTPPPAGQDVE